MSETVDKLKESVMPEQINENDPLLKVEIVEEPYPGVMPEIMFFSARGVKEPIAYSPVIDKFGFAHFTVRRDYAERLLANNGGRKYRLFYPYQLDVRLPNANYGMDLTTIFSWKIEPNEDGSGPSMRLVERSEVEVKALLRAKTKV